MEDSSKDSFSYFDPTQTGDNFLKKVCNVCHRLLLTEQFQINQHGINNRVIRRPSCNDCREIIDGVPLSSIEKRRWDSVKPHMVPFECPICRKRTIPGLTSKVVLDHNHLTGTGRAWICDSCNTGLGRFKDDIDLLHSAIQFLETN
ncbi:endonuclease VII domain-containing protein [Breznakiellaceae bacterium SP9]